MASCVCCGIEIPDGQRTCSMCYGDVDHGTDGYYRRYLEQCAQEARDLEQQYEVAETAYFALREPIIAGSQIS
jgi:hypothetical protein